MWARGQYQDAAGEYRRALTGLANTPGIAGSTVPAGFTDETVTSSLNAPVSLVFLPDGRLLVIEQDDDLASDVRQLEAGL